MFGVELICSDEACAEVSDVTVLSLEELKVLTCDGCGCTLESLNVSEVVELHVAPPRQRQLPRAA